MNRRNTIVLIIIGLGIIAVGAYSYISLLQPSNRIGYGNVTVERAAELIATNPSLVILDVRTDLEFDSGHLEGAVNIPVDELQHRVDELDSEAEMLVYCRTGNRSSSAVQILMNNGFTKIYHMVDGIIVWIEAGYPITSD